jgi:hypothetical protein
MGEAVPRCGAGSLMKIVVPESMCQGVMGVQVRMSSRRQVRVSRCCVHVLVSVKVSLLCPRACLCEGALQLKRCRLRVSTRGSSSSMRGR